MDTIVFLLTCDEHETQKLTAEATVFYQNLVEGLEHSEVTSLRVDAKIPGTNRTESETCSARAFAAVMTISFLHRRGIPRNAANYLVQMIEAEFDAFEKKGLRNGTSSK